MGNSKTWTLITVVSLATAGCAATPDTSEMRQLGADELHHLVIGNTTTQSTNYGRWAEYHATEEVSYARAWGSWGRQDVESTHVTHEDGTMCHQYEGPYKWAGPDHEYCGVLYEDAEGNYYYEVLKNTNKPNKEGRIFEMEIRLNTTAL